MRPGQKRDPEPGTMNAVKNFLVKALEGNESWTADAVKKKYKLTAKEVKALAVRIVCDQKGIITEYIAKVVPKGRRSRRGRKSTTFFNGFQVQDSSGKGKDAGEVLEEARVDVPEFLEGYIPEEVSLEAYIPRKIGEKYDLEILAQAFRERMNVLLVGESGTGKNAVVKAFCAALGLPHKRINLNGGSTVEDMIGSRELEDGETTFRDGVITQFCRHGGVVVLDEVNAADPEQLFVLHGLTDDSRALTLTQKGEGGEVLKASDNFMVVGTMNPLTYEGTRRLNAAFLDRFAIVMFYDWDRDIEAQLIGDKKLLEFAEKVRELYRTREITTPVTTRTLLHFLKTEKLFGRKTSVELMQSRFPAEEAAAVKNFLTLLYDEPTMVKAAQGSKVDVDVDEEDDDW